MSEEKQKTDKVTKDYIGVQEYGEMDGQVYGDMKQKADKGIEKIEKEEKQLARVMRILKALATQRPKRGNWK